MNRMSRVAAVVAATLATAAYAQPAVFTDLGSHNTIVEQFQTDVTITFPTDIQWFRVVLPDAPTASGGYVDIWTEAGGANPMSDVEIGIFDNAGTLIWNDDDSGVGLQSAMSFGGGSGLLIGDAGNLGGDGIGNGENGTLPGGTYWVAVGRFNVTFASGFNVVSTYTGTQTDTVLRFAVAPSTAPFPPSITAVAANPAIGVAGAPVLLTATVSLGGNPVSTGVDVVCDLSSLGGSAAQAMFDNGTNGDITAGDNIYSYSHTIPAASAEQTNVIAMTATDDQARSGTRNLNLPVRVPAQWEEAANGGDAGDLPNTAITVSGSGSLTSIGGSNESNTDVDLFVIDICEPSNFIASTDNLTTTGDTQLWLFTMAGVGVTHNDDKAGATTALRSELTSVNTASLQAGQYILGISRFNRDALDSGGQLLWDACAGGGFTCETGPTGPGAANAVAGWTNNAGSTGTYKITLQGACFAGGSGNCVADVDDGTGTGNDDGAVTIDDLLFYLVAFEAGGVNADIDNGTATGTTDGAVTIDDLLYFLVRFEAGC